MTPRNTRKKMGQKAKRSTSKPRAGTKRSGPKAGDTPDNPVVLKPGEDPPAGARYVTWLLSAQEAAEAREPNRDRAHRWSITYPTRESLFKDTPSERRPPSLEEFHPAALEQFEEARQTAMRILDSGVVGQGECVTTISGQGNTEHRPTNGQPNDGLSIAIRQVGS